MSRKRIIQNKNYKFAIQIYNETSGWDFDEYLDTMNILGSEVECTPYPKWYDTYDEVLNKVNKYDELETDIFYYNE